MYRTVTFIFALLLLSSTALADRAVDETREMRADGVVEFSAVTGQFEIVASDSNRLVITGTLGEDVREMRIEGDADHWRIKLEAVQRQGRMPRSLSASRLTIEVPRAAEVEASTVSADLDVSGVAGRAATLRSVSGSIRLQDIEPQRLHVETVSGPQRIRGGGLDESRLRSVSGNIDADNLAGRIVVNSVSGSVDLDVIDATDIEVETVSGRARLVAIPGPDSRIRAASHSGNVELGLPSASPLQVRASSFSGRIRSDFGGQVQSGRGPGQRLEHRVGDGSVRVEMRSFSGNIRIHHHD